MRRNVKQPFVSQTERNKIDNYHANVKKDGYQPWKTVRQSHTHGQGQIIFSNLTNRAHHLFSRGELIPFYNLEADPTVIDILEQYPLPIDKTLNIARQLNVVHPGAYKERHKYNGKINQAGTFGMR